jgi:hypothetical protein
MIGTLIWARMDSENGRWYQILLIVLGWLGSGICFSLVYSRADDKWEVMGPKIWSYHVALAAFAVAFIFAF